MKVKEAIEILKTYDENSEIQMFCNHERKVENAAILYTEDKKPTFGTLNPLNPYVYNGPVVHCTS